MSLAGRSTELGHSARGLRQEGWRDGIDAIEAGDQGIARPKAMATARSSEGEVV